MKKQSFELRKDEKYSDLGGGCQQAMGTETAHVAETPLAFQLLNVPPIGK